MRQSLEDCQRVNNSPAGHANARSGGGGEELFTLGGSRRAPAPANHRDRQGTNPSSVAGQADS